MARPSSAIVITGWVVQWQSSAGDWCPTHSRDGRGTAVASFRRLDFGMFETRKAAREEKRRCEGEWLEYTRHAPPPHRIRRAYVTVEIA